MRGTLALFALFVLSVAAFAQATLTTDKEDYAPGEVVTLTGAGFAPNEPVDISIAVDSEGQWIPDVAWTLDFADESGGFCVEYIVPQSWADKSLRATAMGLESGRVATALFTDSVSTLTTKWRIAPTGSFGTSLITFTSLPGTVEVQVTYSTSNASGTVALIASIPGVGSQARTVAASTAPLVEVFSFTLPTSLANGLLNVHASANHSAGGPTKNENKNGVIEINVPPPPTNMPPVITPNENVLVDLGQIVGCLDNGSFLNIADISYSYVAGATPNVGTIYATFSVEGVQIGSPIAIATVSDPDAGDTVSVSFTGGISSVTLIGPGMVAALPFSVSATATDDDLAGDTETVGGEVKAQIIYAWGGILNPLNANLATKVKRGSAVPVKFIIRDCENNLITTGSHTVSVSWLSGASPSGDATVDDAGSSGDNGTAFRYDSVGGHWIFNLKTNSTYQANATYLVKIHLADGTVREVQISIKP
jgi:hypothetical protein